jgi:replicative DNA helicase
MADEQRTAQRLPPHNREAERGVLGSMLRDNELIPDVVQLVRAENFYVFAHQKIFEAMTTLHLDRHQPVDPVTLANFLKEKQLIEDAGGYAYIVELWEAAPSAGNHKYYADIIRQQALVRT